MANWVRFHAELREGDKRGIPRAVRFVFLELCLLARPGAGELKLPRGMSDLDALVDLLGGNRREVAEAHRLLVADESIVIDGPDGARVLHVPGWLRWNTVDRSTERVRRFRERNETRSTTVSEPLPTVTETVPDQRREEKIRETPPSGAPTPEVAQPKPGSKADRERRGTRCPSSADRPAASGFLQQHNLPSAGCGPDLHETPTPELAAFLDYHAGKGTRALDWPATWRTWQRNGERFARGKSGAGYAPKSTLQQPAANPADGWMRNIREET